MARSLIFIKLILSILLPLGIIGAATFFSYSKLVTGTLVSTTTTPPPAKPFIVIDKGHREESQRTEDVIRVNQAPVSELSTYITIIDSCGPHFEGECVRARSGPGTDYSVQAKLRDNMVLKVEKTEFGVDGSQWYKISFNEWLRYPKRLTGDWYVSAEYGTTVQDIGDLTTWENEYPTVTGKRIVVDRSEQTLTAYEDDRVFMNTKISTGLELTPTPRGTFHIFKKTPSRYMQGPLPGLADQQPYDLPGVPWNLYFTEGGAVIHGAYWHDSFGSPYSHGCVNLQPDEAKQLYDWADLGIAVVVQD